MSNKNRFRDSMKHASRLPTSLCQDNHRMILAGWSGLLVLLVSMLGHAKVSQAAPASQLMAAECAETCQAHYDTCAEACLTQPASQDDTGASGDDPFACHNKCLEVYTSVYEDIFHACYVERQECSNAIYSRLNPDGSLYCGGGVLFGSMHCFEEDQEKCEPPFQACLRPADVAQEACLAGCTPQPAAPAADEACMNTCQHNQDACVRQCQHPLHGDDSLGFEPLYCMGSEPVPPAEGAPPAESERPSQAKEDQKVAAAQENVRRAEAELSQRRAALGDAKQRVETLEGQLKAIDTKLKAYEGKDSGYARDRRDRLTYERGQIEVDLLLAQAAYSRAETDVVHAGVALRQALSALSNQELPRLVRERREAEERHMREQDEREAHQRKWDELRPVYESFGWRKRERLIPQTICLERGGGQCAAGDVKKETYDCSYTSLAPGSIPVIGRMGQRLEESEENGLRNLLSWFDLYQDTVGVATDAKVGRWRVFLRNRLHELRGLKGVGLPTPDITFPGMGGFAPDLLEAIGRIPAKFGVITQVTFPVTVKEYELTDTFTCLETGLCAVVPWKKDTTKEPLGEFVEQVTLYCVEHYDDCDPASGEELAELLGTLAYRAFYEALADNDITSHDACPEGL